MKTIWKYSLNIILEQIVEMPLNSKILTVQTQYGDPVMWALVDTKELVKEKRHIIIYATGHRIYVDNNDLKYISTFQIGGDSGDLVFHVFELIK